MAGAMAPIQMHAAVAEKGLVCADQGSLLSRWTATDDPLSSLVAHWFDDKRISLVIWQSQITNCNTFRIGGIVLMKEITDINTTNSRSTSQVNWPF